MGIQQQLLTATVPVTLARYWRLRDPVGTSFLTWRIDNQLTQGIISAASDLSGTNLAVALTTGTNFGFGNPGGYTSQTIALGNGNPFSEIGTDTIAMTTTADQTVHFDFGSAKTVGSLLYQNNPDGSHQPTSMNLEYSSDDSSFSLFATLTNAGQITPSYWRNITKGSTIAAAAS